MKRAVNIGTIRKRSRPGLRNLKGAREREVMDKSGNQGPLGTLRLSSQQSHEPIRDNKHQEEGNKKKGGCDGKKKKRMKRQIKKECNHADGTKFIK